MNKIKSKPNYLTKSLAIKMGYDVQQRLDSKGLYILSRNMKYGSSNYKAVAEAYYALYDKVSHDITWNCFYAEAVKINHAFYERKKRLQKRILSFLKGNKNAAFLTLTFDNETLSNTNEDTRRQYVFRFLKQNCLKYVANKDFGEDFGREHYHAVVVLPDHIKVSRDMFSGKWGFGYSNTEKIRVESSTDIKLAKYITKLTNHAIKETTQRSVLIYSR